MFFFLWCTSAAFAMNRDRNELSECTPLLGFSGDIEDQDVMEETNTSEFSDEDMWSLNASFLATYRNRYVRRNYLNYLACTGVTILGIAGGALLGGALSVFGSAVWDPTSVTQYAIVGFGVGSWIGSIVGGSAGISVYRRNQIQEIVGRADGQFYDNLFNPSPPPDYGSIEPILFPDTNGTEGETGGLAHHSEDDEPSTEGSGQHQQSSHQESEDSSGSNQHSMLSSSRESFPGRVTDDTISLLPGYNRGSQMQSLLGLQGVLVEMSEQVSTTLKLLALKPNQNFLLCISMSSQRFKTKYPGVFLSTPYCP